jgi:hypothetical protein
MRIATRLADSLSLALTADTVDNSWQTSAPSFVLSELKSYGIENHEAAQTRRQCEDWSPKLVEALGF